jgi:hypothetical protein
LYHSVSGKLPPHKLAHTKSVTYDQTFTSAKKQTLSIEIADRDIALSSFIFHTHSFNSPIFQSSARPQIKTIRYCHHRIGYLPDMSV